MEPRRYTVLGAGRQGRAIVYGLLNSDNFTNIVTLIDSSQDALEAARTVDPDDRVVYGLSGAADKERVAALGMQEGSVVISALPYYMNLDLARLAIEHRCHWVDLGGHTPTTLKVIELGRLLAVDDEASVYVVPDAGLSPGLTNIMAAEALYRLGDKADSIKIYVGGLPQDPVPPLNYQVVYSVDGLASMYTGDCDILNGGFLHKTKALTGVESIEFDALPGADLEAFYASGGLSTLPYSDLATNVDYMAEKTVRYAGHAQAISEMVQIYGKEALASRLRDVLPKEGPDIVLCRVEGVRGNYGYDLELVEYRDPETGLSAMSRVTGFSAATVARLCAEGLLGGPGAKLHEGAINPSVFFRALGRHGIEVRGKMRVL